MGFPELLSENVEALSVWSDLQGLGGPLTVALTEFPKTEFELGDLHAKLRILADERELFRQEERDKDK